MSKAVSASKLPLTGNAASVWVIKLFVNCAEFNKKKGVALPH